MRKNNFLTTLKIASRYLLDRKHSSLVMTCENCGAVCREVQLWNYTGDYTKLCGALWTMDLK